ncbi:MAG: bifunctional nuclease family protein [Nitrospinae bacterium]|nr:bifunctional nuclease family protein [Nitrospinota bacterium]
MVEMKVEGLVFDPVTNTPIIILKDTVGEKSLPIWVGYPEATAIALEMESVATPRPMTHDLIKNLLAALRAKVNHIVVNDLKSNTFFAVISLTFNGGAMEVDSRPSDAIAVALRVKAPIYVTQSVLDNAKTFDGAAAAGAPEDDEQFKKWLDNIRPSDFGKLDQ